MFNFSNLFSPHIFEFPLITSIFSYEIQNTSVTLLILLLFSLIIVEEPITHLFVKEERTEHEKFEFRHFWETLILIPIMVVPFLWVMYRYGIFSIHFSGGIIGFMVMQFFAMMLLHDCYFYWCHRLLHTKALWKIHGIHHQAVDPTIVSSHVFHYIETFINFSFVIWFTLLTGLLFGGLYYIPALIFILYTITWNIYGHGKKNLLPITITNSFIGKYIVWPSYHLQHHRKGTGNFSFFFTFWDRMCRTRS
jgi:lathosterol oxidase